MAAHRSLRERESSPGFLAGGGEMGRLIRAMDWSRTPLGPVESWPQSLRSAVSIMLPSKAQIALFWGEELIGLYNDAYRPVFGAKHPVALGRPIREAWAELWRAGLAEIFGNVLATGEAFWARDMPFYMERHGYPEETYFDVSYDPIRDESGRVGGLFCIVSETTGRVLGARRLRTLRDLARIAQDAREVGQVWSAAAAVLTDAPEDIPFALLYEAQPGGGARLAAAVRMDAGTAPAPLELAGHATSWPLGPVARVLRNADLAPFGDLVAGPWPERIHEAVVLPIAGPDAHPAAYLVCGVGARRRVDDDYFDFFTLAASNIANAFATVHKAESERRRAEMLAELDRAKTQFFSNVSHEFRTPLTLMLGPLEDALADMRAPLDAAQRERVELAHRNGLRLQKLVNTLLDYSRIEAGRARASYRPTDLATFTRELASTFRSAADKAGLRLDIDCPPLTHPVYVDHDMWEKIVFNLLSNALKFTFDGSIGIALREERRDVVLEVRDTGTGIPAAELPRIFERFHRVEGARSRTHEGTGIGLSLVEELVKLHGGTIAATSREAEGTRFRVRIPTGREHLAAEHVVEEPAAAPAVFTSARAFVEEATRWLGDPHEAGPQTDPGVQPAKPRRPRIVLADDNADMRAYVARLLRDRYDVEAVADGEEALAAVRERGAELLLTDVMMPRLDGIGLARRLRADARTRNLPIIMLSARAGEESRIEGHEAGADDYLYKPFTARELQGRVAARLELSALQRQLDQERQDMSAMFAETPVGIAVIRGPELVFDFVNQPYCDAIGGRDVTGMRLLDAMPELARQGFDALLHQVMATGKPFVGREMPVQLERGNGVENVFFTYIYAPLRGPQGTFERVIVICSDVTESVRARERVEKLAAEAHAELAERRRIEAALKESDRRKDEFLATLAHELRNPLAPLRNAMELARVPRLGAPQRERIHQVMERQMGHLVRLVDDLMEVSRISRGALELRREHVELAAVLHNAVETSTPLLQAGGHTLEIANVPPLWVDGDPVRLAQILSNLLNNAAKYTPDGGRVRIAVEADAATASISVTDNGVGIDAEDLPRLFEMFRRGDPSRRRDQTGLGIGLALAQRLARMHGGGIEVRSEGPGRGSCFTLHLPLARVGAPASEVAATNAAQLPAMPVLIVDDNADAADTLQLVLEHLGLDPVLARDGPQALEAFAAAPASVVLLDIGMPGMDGYEVARRIRGLPGGREATLVALTGWGQESDRRLAVEAGIDHHFTKPADPRTLESLLRSLAARRGLGSPP
jgi:signal transduction histidine kinase/DNA-binding response OmpR family regulator